MFDIGWAELVLIAIVILFAFGPEDIPKLMYGLGRIVRRFRYMRFALSSQFEDFMEKAEKQGRAPGSSAAPAQAALEQDDEGDADAHLLDMMPPPENVQATDITRLPDIENETETDERPASSTPDRG